MTGTPALSREQPRDRKDAALDRAEKAIRDYLDGNYDNPRRYRGKTQKCPHGIFYWEACENCIDAHFQAALADIGELRRER